MTACRNCRKRPAILRATIAPITQIDGRAVIGEHTVHGSYCRPCLIGILEEQVVEGQKCDACECCDAVKACPKCRRPVCRAHLRDHFCRTTKKRDVPAGGTQGLKPTERSPRAAMRRSSE